MKTCRKDCIHGDVCGCRSYEERLCEHFKDKARYVELTDDIIFILTAIAWGCSANEALSPCAEYHVDNELLGNRKILISEALYQFDKLLIEIAKGRAPSRRAGEWKDMGYYIHNKRIYKCSVCANSEAKDTLTSARYCPNCGAKMKGGAE